MRVLALLVILTTATVAFAERDPDRAKQLFEEGRALFKDENWDAACAKFAQSLALDDATGTKVNLAECIVHQDKLVEAYDLFREAISEDEAAGGNDRRLEFSRERRAALAARLVTVRVTVEQPDGVTLSINDETIGSSLAKPVVRVVAPGDVVVTARARSFPKWSRTQTASAGDKVTFEVPAFVRADAGTDEPTRRRRSRVYLALGLGVGGLVALIAGGLTGLEGQRQFDATLANGLCTPIGDELHCSVDGANQISDAKDLTFLANTLAIAGGALVVTGVVVFLTAPRERVPDARRISVAPLLRSDAIGLVFDGRF